MIAKGMPPEYALAQFMKFVGDSPIIGHNSKFDIRMINNGLTKYKIPPLQIPPEKIFCTMNLFKVFFHYSNNRDCIQAQKRRI